MTKTLQVSTILMWITLGSMLLLTNQTFGNSLENIKFKDLPLELAITKVIGNGQTEIAYFADPNCKYCKILEEETLPLLKNVKIHMFIYPILGKNSEELADAIWCSDNRLAAWSDYSSRNQLLQNKEECESSVGKITEFGKKHGIHGTPTIFLDNGRHLVGTVSLAQLEEELYLEAPNEGDSEEKTGFLYEHPGFCGGNNMINH